MSTKNAKHAAQAAQETVQTAHDVAQDTAAKMQDAFASFQDKLEVPAAAREFMQRSVASAKERLADAHAGANNATVTYEKAATTLIGGGAAVLRSLFDASYENTVATFALAEKLATAKSLQEAYQIQSDFARDAARANWARVQATAETVKANVQDSVKLFQDEATRVMSIAKKAA